MEKRYEHLLRPGARYDRPTGEDDKEKSRQSQDYAQFLREKERKCCRDGFVDSHNNQKSFNTNNSSVEKKKESSNKKDKQENSQTSVVDLLARKDKDKKEHDKRLKVIEDHMWQHKQEEREMKRVEGDIIKNQRTLRHSLRDYENAITRKRLTEEKKLSQSMDMYNKQEQQHRQKRENVTKQRIEASLSADQSYKDQGRRVQLTTSDLARQYRTKSTELDLRRVEVSHLMEDFESKLRSKEEEQHKLTQELADLAITLNMEAQKGRAQEIDHKKDKKKEQQQCLEEDRTAQEDQQNTVMQKESDSKTSEQNRRRMSADMTQTRSKHQLKQREEQRHRKDADNQLRDNLTIQKQLNEAAIHADMDHKNRQINQKIQDHNQRRQQLATQSQVAKKDQSVEHENHYKQRFQKRHDEQQRREHEDHLKHFQKAVTRGEDSEHSMYTTVKNAEYNRQQKEQSVRHLSLELQETRRQNMLEIRKHLKEASDSELQLQQKLAREQAELAKEHARREDMYQQLQKQRDSLREDRYLLEKHDKEHQRLVRIGTKTETMYG